MSNAAEVVETLRRICLALPEATEKEAWGDPTFRVRDKIFAMVDHSRASFWCKAPEGAQEILVGAEPETFFVPPYVGHKGWIGVRIADDGDWEQVAGIVHESYRMTAPKRLLKLLDEDA
ncbi:MAG: MmcQ/YjbR family DNA-binding protein [Dehalococcoidia bacterium]|nr:MmcQ/YjbR family DNA-binding protein [Dehalococcoidia bacterium]